MKKLIILITFIGILNAKYYPDALFGKVSGIASNDTLSVRIHPNWRSKKITELPPNAFVGVDSCVKVGRSTWCKVYTVNRNLGQYLEYSDKLPGWVNAKYLKFSNRGYVKIKGKKQKCNYAINCSKGKCDIVNVFRDIVIKNSKIVSIKSKKYSRERLKGIGELDFKSQNSSAYVCNRRNIYIEDYLNKKHTLNAKKSAKEFLKALQSKKISKIKDFIHPSYGIILTNKLSFAQSSFKFFTKESFIKFYKNGNLLDWGEDNAKGDRVKISLKKFLELKYPLSRVSKIKTLNSLKGFKKIKNTKLKAYEFFWKGKGEFANYNWIGADLILAKIDKKWYVVAFLWNRWSI